MKTLTYTIENTTTSNLSANRLGFKIKAIIFAVASIIFGISGASAQVEPSVDVIVATPFVDGYADSSVTHNVCFKNTSLTSNDRINISAKSTQGWVVALFDNNEVLMGIDADGDGSWDYVPAAFDADQNGEPDTRNLAPGVEECLNFMLFIPAEAAEGTIDTLAVTGFSIVDRNIKDVEIAMTEISNLQVLPIELLSFNAALNGKSVILTWETATEINNEYFSVERSSDGKTFNEIMVVKGAGNSNAITAYSTEDNEPVNGVAYYRLKQTDYDGQSETFKAVMVRNTKAVQTITIEQNAYPNPFSGTFSLGYSVEDKGQVTATVSDIQGKIVSKEVMSAVKGYNMFSFDNGSSLPAGMYFVSLESNGNVISTKVSKTSNF